jgi:putative ABC transport system ATP-binding protein
MREAPRFDTTERARLRAALAHLAQVAEAPADRDRIDAALIEAHETAPDGEAWTNLLSRAARRLGLETSVLSSAPAADVVALGERAVVRAPGGGTQTLVGEHSTTALELRAEPELVPVVRARLEAAATLPSVLDAVVLRRAAVPLGIDCGPEASPWRRLWGLVAAERRDLLVVVFYAIGVGVTSLAAPIAVQSFLGVVAFGALLQPLVVLATLLAGALILAAALVTMQALVVELIARRFFVRTAAAFGAHLPRLRLDRLAGKEPVELVNRFLDVVTVEKALVALAFDGLASVLQIGVGLALLAVYHPFLLALDLFLVALIGVVVVVGGRGAVDTAVLESKKKYGVVDWLEGIAGTRSTFRSWRGAAYAEGRLETLLGAWLHYRRKHFKISFRQLVGMLGLQVLASSTLLLLGGGLVIEGQLSLGQLVAAELVITATVAGLAKIGKLFAKLYDLLAALDKIGGVLDLPGVPHGGALLPSAEQGLSVDTRGVGLVTEDGRRDLFGVDLHVAAGERVALHGGPGGRPTALFDVLTGARAPTEGVIRLGGLDLRELDPGGLNEHVMVLADDAIFPGSVADNLTLGAPEVTPAGRREALRRLGLDRGLDALPNGLDTPLMRDGSPLDEDQRRLLLVARAVLLRPRLLLVDRMLDGMAPETQARALAVLNDPEMPWTVLCSTTDVEVERRLGRSVRFRPRPRVTPDLADGSVEEAS